MNKQKKRLGSISLCKVVLICLFLSVFSTAWAAVEQTSSKITVTGVVKDVQGEPLIGATIKIKGSAVGTVSDFDGNYSLANVPVNGVLEFSYVGMNSIEISVSSSMSRWFLSSGSFRYPNGARHPVNCPFCAFRR